MTPTIASLMKIAAALGRSVSYFVEEPATPDVSVVRRDERAPVYTSKHGLDLQNISGRYGPFLIAGAEAVMAPYADSGPTPMNHPGEELVIVTGGAMRFTVDGRRYDLEAGDSIHFRTLLPHSWGNPHRAAGPRDLARRPLLLTCLWLEGVHDLLDAVLDGVADAIYLVGPRGEVRLINPAGLAVLGYDRAERAAGPRQPRHDPPHATRRHAVPGRAVPAAAGAHERAHGARRAGLVRPPRRLDGAGGLRLGAVSDRRRARRRRRLPRHLRAAGVRGGARARGRRAGPRGGARRARARGWRAPPRPSGAGSAATSTTAPSSGWSERSCGSRRRAA